MFNYWGRPQRNIPPVNYAEDSESEEDLESGLNFNSPLQSPQRPVHTRQASPQDLAHPTLADNVDEELEEVAWKLHDINQVEEEIEDLTDILISRDSKQEVVRIWSGIIIRMGDQFTPVQLLQKGKFPISQNIINHTKSRKKCNYS